MKNLLLFSLSFLLVIELPAQITIDYSTAPSNAQCATPDTTIDLQLSNLPNLSPKTNAAWDLTGTVPVKLWTYFNTTASSSAFPNAKFVFPIKYNFSSLQYNSQQMNAVTSAGIVEYGEHIDRQAIDISSFTGNAGDSLVFPTQDVAYSPNRMYIKYPITMGNSWTDVSVQSTNFNLTVAAFGLFNTPGVSKTEFKITHTVVGWGKMKTVNRKSKATIDMDVLQIEVVMEKTDSFFLGGSPAPAPLMAAFGLSQGQKDYSYVREFHRVGQYKPLLEVKYSDNTFTNATRAESDNSRIVLLGISNIPVESINIYPNPVTNGSFTVKVDGTHKDLSYQLLNITGQQVAAGNVPANGKISLQQNLPAGTYIIKLTSTDGALGVERINIIH